MSSSSYDNNDIIKPEEAKVAAAEQQAAKEGVKPEAVDTKEEAVNTVQLQEQVAELKDKLLRASAEEDNTRRRLTKEIEDVAKYSITNFAYDMVEVLENLYRAKESIPTESMTNDPVAQSIYQGVERTLDFMLKNLEKHGVKRLYPLDQEFDHNFHQALSQIEAQGKAAGTIVQVVQAGYIIKDRLLRPALVVVAK